MRAALSATADLELRAAHRLRRDPPLLRDARADLKGDHVLDRRGLLTATGTPPTRAAVLIAIVDHPDEPTILLTERAATLRKHSGQIAFPGGRMDPEDATPADTAFREAEEEIGLDRRLARPLGFLDAYLSGTNYYIVPTVALVEPGFDLAVNAHEVASVFEVPLEFLMSERNHELHARAWGDTVRQYYAIPFGERYIWGVTAGILRNMFERLYGP